MSLLNDLESILKSNGLAEAGLTAALGLILDHFQCSAGTVHIFDESSGMLVLCAAQGVPEVVLDRVRTVPIGKGMAGLAAERREPVQVCNLQSDQSGVAKPVARETKMGGSIAVPMLVEERLRGVIGVAKIATHEFDEVETNLLLQIARLIGTQCEPRPVTDSRQSEA